MLTDCVALERDFCEPRAVADRDECDFYHTVELPGHGLIRGQWDLRGRLDTYLGKVDLTGKRVLDIGTATGFIAFSLERRGAEVVAYDLSERDDWDVVPYSTGAPPDFRAKRREHIRRINNGFWLCHNAFGSRVRLAHGSIYSLPDGLGEVDVSILGCVLLHCRDPFLALQAATRVTKESIIVVERPPNLQMLIGALRVLRIPLPTMLALGKPSLQFLPSHRRRSPTESWWRIPPRTLVEFLAILGFADARLSYHVESYRRRPRVLYTVVARRTARLRPAELRPEDPPCPAGEALDRPQ